MNAAFPETVIAANYISWLNRIAYSFVDLVAGIIAVLIIVLQNTILVHSRLIQYRLGNPAAQFDVPIMMFAAYAVFSLAGWFLVGISTALLPPYERLPVWAGA